MAAPEVVRACGITVQSDRIMGAEGERGELVVRRAEVVALRLGSAPSSELPWIEGPIGILLAVLATFLVGTWLDRTRGTYNGAAAALLALGAVTLLSRTFLRRAALLIELRSGDRRRIWTTGSDGERAKLIAALRAQRWPLVA